MQLYTLNPFNELERLERQINRAFNEIAGDDNSRNWSIPIQLEEQAETFILRALLPAINREDLDIEVTRESVAIAGEYHKPQPGEDNKRFYSEFPVGKFRRTLSLPLPVMNNEAQAEYQDGVLALTLPKAPEAVHRVVKLNVFGDSEPQQIEPESSQS